MRSSQLSPIDEKVQANFSASLAGNTRRSYQYCIQQWLDSGGEVPAQPYDIAKYLSSLAQKAGYPSVKMHAAALSNIHREKGFENPFDNTGLQKVMSGIHRTAQHQPQQADGLDSMAYKHVVTAARVPRTTRAGRTESKAVANTRATLDIALIGLMRDAMLRRSEAAALTWQDFWRENDGKGRVMIRRSKTDQAGEGKVMYVSHNVTTMVLQLKKQSDNTEPADLLFGIGESQITRRIAAATRAAGLEGRYSGHSPRIGMAQDLARSGCSIAELMEAGRWKSPQMPAYYLRSVEAGRGAVARYYGET